jgi:hypothetical protein
MPLIPFAIPPGVVKTNTPWSATGRWIDTDHVRFTNGKAEKIGGIQKFFPDQFEGLARGAIAWASYAGTQSLMWGTNDKLYVYANSTVTDITPYRGTRYNFILTNPFTTVNLSPIVTVHDVNHGISVAGVLVTFSGASAVGGITINGDYLVTNVIDPSNYTITHSSPASSGATGGGTVTASYLLNPGDTSPSYQSGWGVGGWGQGTWGQSDTPAQNDLVEMRWWSFANYGEDVMLNPLNETIYHYDVSLGFIKPVPVTNAPAQVRYVVVTPERYIFALGCTTIAGPFDAMTVRWPDVDDFTDWSPSSIDTANERKLQGGTRLMGGTALTAGVTLVWSDYAIWTFQFTGGQFVYDSKQAGTECGLVGPHAFCRNDQMAFWMSALGFHVFSGYVESIPNQENMLDWVQANIDLQNRSKTIAFYNKNYNEVWFVFPTTTTEPDTYVAVDLDTWEWFNGTLSRTAVAKYTSGETRPIMFGPNSYAYIHEVTQTSNDDGAVMEAHLQSAPFALSDGNQSADIFGIVPDFQKQNGIVEITIRGYDHPQDVVMDQETLEMNPSDTIVDARVSGRQLDIKFSSNVIDGNFRNGTLALELTGAGIKR